MDRTQLLDAYRRMAVIRRMEERISILYRDGLVPGFVHPSDGRETCAVGALFHARPGDVITSTHRGHGPVPAKGLEPQRIPAHVLGRETGASRCRGDAM